VLSLDATTSDGVIASQSRLRGVTVRGWLASSKLAGLRRWPRGTTLLLDGFDVLLVMVVVAFVRGLAVGGRSA
jgi:hypothetical protein